MRSLVFALALMTAGPASAAAQATVFKGITTTRPHMNPTAGESVELRVTLTRAGRVDALVVDRDGFPVRTLAQRREVAAGANAFVWDGRADDGRIVPDEAYSFKVDWTDGPRSETYFPAAMSSAMQTLKANYYSARTATLSYTLAVPSRVHVQAGVVRKNPRTGRREGPVLKTIVNREPREAGLVAEHWSGLDESGIISVYDQPDFVVAIAAFPLPANSVIVVGNRQSTFAESALARRGESLVTRHAGSHEHHAGLSVLDDISPGLVIEPLNGRWSAEERAWIVDRRTVELQLKLGGPAAASFQRQPGEIIHFVDQRVAGKVRPNGSPLKVSVPDSAIHQISVNWRSDYGAVAANTIRVRVGPRTVAAGDRKGAGR
jgi:hypothetical protein